MDGEDRKFILTAAWIFSSHGQSQRALPLLAALNEANPLDGTAAAAYAEILIAAGQYPKAAQVLRLADVPEELERAAAVLESRALLLSGKEAEAGKRWQRHLRSAAGAKSWIKDSP